MLSLRTIATSILIAATPAAAIAQQFKAGDITIEKPWARATPKGAAVAGGYLVIANGGAQPDKLLGGTADFAGAVQIHSMTMANGVMRMRPMTGGLDIPAKGQVALTPGAYHLMFVGLKRPLAKGEAVAVALTFEHAGSIPVTFQVGGIGDTGPGGATKAGAGADMKGMKM